MNTHTLICLSLADLSEFIRLQQDETLGQWTALPVLTAGAAMAVARYV